MNTLAVGPFLLIENGVFILGQHFLLPGHLSVPPLKSSGGLSVPLQSRIEGVYHTVNGA